jgi:predicted HNH restriction endonuclease
MTSSGFLAAKHYVLYWKLTPEERLALNETRSAAYATHPQLARVKPGDVLWFVNVYLGRLFLLGRLRVEIVADDSELAQELVGSYRGEWQEADWYALANKYSVEKLREVEITPLAGLLRFNSRYADRLTVDEGGHIEATQFRALRELNHDSAKILDDIWYEEVDVPQSVQDYLELTEDDTSYAEGKIVTRTVRQRQRSRLLVQDAKLQFKSKFGHLHCQICGFDFLATYGIEYIEAHHTQPMASIEEEQMTSVSELGMVCANCHRMIHQRTPPYSLEEVKSMIQANQRVKYGHSESD